MLPKPPPPPKVLPEVVVVEPKRPPPDEVVVGAPKAGLAPKALLDVAPKPPRETAVSKSQAVSVRASKVENSAKMALRQAEDSRPRQAWRWYGRGPLVAHLQAVWKRVDNSLKHGTRFVRRKMTSHTTSIAKGTSARRAAEQATSSVGCGASKGGRGGGSEGWIGDMWSAKAGWWWMEAWRAMEKETKYSDDMRREWATEVKVAVEVTGRINVPEVVVLLVLLEPKPKPLAGWVFCWPKPPKPPKDILKDVAVAMEARGDGGDGYATGEGKRLRDRKEARAQRVEQAVSQASYLEVVTGD